MSFAFLPLYTGDYLRDTRHLSPQKHGVYLLLLMHCWDQKGPLPLDEQECAGIANCRSADEIESLRYVLSKYFIRMDDGWYNLRMTKEVKRSESISNARSEAGKLGYQAKAKQLLSKSQASATTPTPTTIPTTIPRSSKPLARSANALQAIGSGEKRISIPSLQGDVEVLETAVVEWETLFPAVDVGQTLNEIRAWCIANPAKRKTAKGVPRFINTWLTKEQNRG